MWFNQRKAYTHSMYYSVPCKSCVVYYYMYLPIAKLGCFLHKLFNVIAVQDVAGDCQRLPAGLVDTVCYGLRLFCRCLS